jgi:hypothetical protein
MSKERELLKKVLATGWLDHTLSCEVEAILARPKQNIAGAVMPNGVCVSNVYEAYEAGRYSILSEKKQEPVAWITEWVQRYRHDDTPIIDRAVSFTKGGAPAVPNPNYIPLYLAPPKREPLTNEEVIAKYRDITLDNPLYTPSYYAGFRDAEQAHGIGV